MSYNTMTFACLLGISHLGLCSRTQWSENHSLVLNDRRQESGDAAQIAARLTRRESSRPNSNVKPLTVTDIEFD